MDEIALQKRLFFRLEFSPTHVNKCVTSTTPPCLARVCECLGGLNYLRPHHIPSAPRVRLLEQAADDALDVEALQVDVRLADAAKHDRRAGGVHHRQRSTNLCSVTWNQLSSCHVFASIQRKLQIGFQWRMCRCHLLTVNSILSAHAADLSSLQLTQPSYQRATSLQMHA